MNVKQYGVIFTGDFFTLRTCVDASNEYEALTNARQLLLDYHGINTEQIGETNAEVELEGEWLI